jgi:hypothetical protein
MLKKPLCGDYTSAIFLLLMVALCSRATGFAQVERQSSGLAPRIHEELIAEVQGRIAHAWTKSRILYEVAPVATVPFGRRLTARATDHVFWIEERPGHLQALWLDGKQVGGEYAEVRDVVPSKDFQQVAFTTRRGSKWVLMINGKDRTPEFEAMLSPDITASGRFVVPIRKHGKWQILDNGQAVGPEFQESKWFLDIPISDAAFDDSGTHYGFVARRHEKWITVIDGKAVGAEMDKIGQTVERRRIIPRDSDWVGEHFAVAAEINGNWSWVVDGKPGPTFDTIGEISSTPDGKHYAYAGATFLPGKSSGSIVLDGNIIATHTGDGLEREHLRKDLYRGVGRFLARLHGVSDPGMLDDGTPVYAMCRGEDDVVLVRNGVPGPSFEDIGNISVTVDGRHITYIGSRGDSRIAVRDQTADPRFNSPRNWVAWTQVSDDGLHLAYETNVSEHDKSLDGITDTARIFVDGKADPEFQTYNREKPVRVRNFHFSEDGRHYFYQIDTFLRTRCFFSNNCAGAVQRLIVVDGAQVGGYEYVLPGARFLDPHTVQFIARQGNRLLRVRYEVGN